MNQLILKNPDIASAATLILITVGAIYYGLTSWPPPIQRQRIPVSKEYQLPYQLDDPDEVFTLPKVLKEISGMCHWRGQQVLTIQDEDGIIFVFDLLSGQVVDKIKFGKDRDYEGITKNDSTIFILEGDGDIFALDYYRGMTENRTQKMETDFSFDNDTEGIAYDPRSQRLLVVPKGEQHGMYKTHNHYKAIYSLNPNDGFIDPAVPLYINQFDVGEHLYGTKERYVFKPSGLAIHPSTGHIYVLANV
ncbi:MAG: SdiA-regulated domain-containing protein, partial [Bacteroidota bacterium]